MICGAKGKFYCDAMEGKLLDFHWPLICSIKGKIIVEQILEFLNGIRGGLYVGVSFRVLWCGGLGTILNGVL